MPTSTLSETFFVASHSGFRRHPYYFLVLQSPSSAAFLNGKLQKRSRFREHFLIGFGHLGFDFVDKLLS